MLDRGRRKEKKERAGRVSRMKVGGGTKCHRYRWELCAGTRNKSRNRGHTLVLMSR